MYPRFDRPCSLLSPGLLHQQQGGCFASLIWLSTLVIKNRLRTCRMHRLAFVCGAISVETQAPNSNSTAPPTPSPRLLKLDVSNLFDAGCAFPFRTPRTFGAQTRSPWAKREPTTLLSVFIRIGSLAINLDLVVSPADFARGMLARGLWDFGCRALSLSVCEVA
ncbi:hypothetical protein B0I37DRAFT_51478 [Chaetomium sp. MPI-CAGE-AT-0009]|nr:hypothetical protein B0I37DRAFT_51478 [Chaetomium sp. MPI-CAGE-AT-0009]